MSCQKGDKKECQTDHSRVPEETGTDKNFAALDGNGSRFRHRLVPEAGSFQKFRKKRIEVLITDYQRLTPSFLARGMRVAIAIFDAPTVSSLGPADHLTSDQIPANESRGAIHRFIS